jgi:hypothetical protein
VAAEFSYTAVAEQFLYAYEDLVRVSRLGSQFRKSL